MDERDATLVDLALDRARQGGASQVAVRLGRSRFVDLRRRAGRVESLESSQSRSLGIQLYVDGRYSSSATSLLEEADLRAFIDDALRLTRALAPDPYRTLPSPDLYGTPDLQALDLRDPSHDALCMDTRLALLAEVEAAALDRGGDAVISAQAQLHTTSSEAWVRHSDGFSGCTAGTRFALGATVVVHDEGNRRPEDHAFASARYIEDLPPAATLGQEAATRALARRGAVKAASGRRTLVLENRTVGRLLGLLLAPLAASALQQRRSCFEGRVGQTLASPLFTLVDDPTIPRGLGSRAFDSEGLAPPKRPIFEDGVLRDLFVDTYYGNKLGLRPTSGQASNLCLPAGTLDLAGLIAEVDHGILVQGFLGGNANPATGDFSLGLSGQEIVGGRLVRPVGEMNLSGHLLHFWKNLVALGRDLYPFSPIRVPSLRIEGVEFSGQ